MEINKTNTNKESLNEEIITNSQLTQPLPHNLNQDHQKSTNTPPILIPNSNPKPPDSPKSQKSDTKKNPYAITQIKNSYNQYQKDFIKTMYEKVLYLQNLHNFFNTYIEEVLNILQTINFALHTKITNILDQNKSFLAYFKDIISSYQRLSEELIKSNSNMQKFDKDKKSSLNIFGAINATIEKGQKSVSAKLLNFGNMISNQIITKGPFVKIRELYNKLNLHHKNYSNLINIITQKKDKLAKLNKEHYKVFDVIIKSIDKLEFDIKYEDAIKKNDIFNLEVQYIKKYNKCLGLLINLISTTKVMIGEFRLLLTEFITLINESIHKFLSEADKTFSFVGQDLVQTLNSINNTLTKDTIDAVFQPINLFSENNLNTSLMEYLIKFACNNNKYLFVQNKIINLEENLSLKKFANVEGIVMLLQQYIPLNIEITRSNFILKIFDFKRDPSLIMKSRPAFIVLTYQNNLIIYDEKINNKPIDIYRIEFVSLKVTNEKKHRFDLTEDDKKSLFPSSYTFEASSKDKLAEIEAYFKK